MGRPSKNLVLPDGTVKRECAKCCVVKHISDFNLTCTRYHAYCRTCLSAYSKPRNAARYASNPELHRAKARIENAEARIPKQELANAVKERTPCVDCKNKFPSVCMDFDHILPGSKIEGVSQMVNSGGWTVADVAAEILKCEVVCANCHRIRTSKRPKWRKGVASGSPD